MKRNLAPLLGVAFVAALIATGFFYGLLIPRLRGGGESVDQSRVVVVAKEADRGVRLTAQHLELAPVAAGRSPEGAIRTVEEAVGLTLLERASPRQVLTSAMVTRHGLAGGTARVIPAGMRAVTVHPKDSTGVVAMLQSGSRVDIQVLGASPAGARLVRVLENVEVLNAGSQDAFRTGRPVVTLMVSPRDADRLSLADASLNIRLVLRNPEDAATDGPVSVTASSLYENRVAAPAPTPTPAND
jgi:pilus assembly protein CpaB